MTRQGASEETQFLRRPTGGNTTNEYNRPFKVKCRERIGNVVFNNLTEKKVVRR